MKRPSCKWKGQTAPMKHLPEGAGSPISRMPQQQKAGYNQYTSPNLCLFGLNEIGRYSHSWYPVFLLFQVSSQTGRLFSQTIKFVQLCSSILSFTSVKYLGNSFSQFLYDFLIETSVIPSKSAISLCVFTALNLNPKM